MYKTIKYLIFSALLMYAGSASGQRILVVYYNTIGKEVRREFATGFSEYNYTDTGVNHKRFFIATNKIALSEHFKDSLMEVKEGKFHSFYPNEQLRSAGSYINNQKQGQWLEFYPNGYLQDSAWYENGTPSLTRLKWYSNGMMADSIHYGNKYGTKASWFDNGNPNAIGKFKKVEDSLLGKWSYYDKNGWLAAEEEYDIAGTLQTTKYFDQQGKEMPVTSDLGISEQKELIFKELREYIGDRLDFGIRNNERDVFISAAVRIVINEEGKLEEIYSVVPESKKYEAILIKTLKSYTKWKPLRHKNRNLRLSFTYHISYNKLPPKESMYFVLLTSKVYLFQHYTDYKD